MMDLHPAPVEPHGAIVVRHVDVADRVGLQAFYADLSGESRRRRFLGFTSGIRAEQSRAFCSPDHHHAEGFVAVLDNPGADDGRIVGHLCMEPEGAGGIELAVAVADDHQGRGIGRRLFEAAISWAQQEGFLQVSATAFVDNTAVLRLLSSAPHGARMKQEQGGIVSVVDPADSPPPAPGQYPASPLCFATNAAACARRWRFSLDRIELT